jgi:hypothetical protein
VRHLILASVFLFGCALNGCGGGGHTSSSAIPATGGVVTSSARLSDTTALSYPNVVLAANPLAYYQLNDSGSTLADSGPKRLSGSYGANVGHGGAALTSAAGTHSSIFSGAPARSPIAANSATVPTNPLFAAATHTLTVEAWVKAASLNTTNRYVPIVSYGREEQGQAWVVQVSPQSTVDFWIKAKGGKSSFYSVKGATVLVPGRTFHVVTTFDGANARIYVNGRLDSNLGATGTLDYSGLGTQFGLSIGGALGSTEPIFNGAISDVSIYDSALPPGEVQQHYVAGFLAATPTAPATGSPSTPGYPSLVAQSGPLAYYRLGDTGSALADSGAHGLTGVYGPNVRHSSVGMTSAGIRSQLFPGSLPGSDVAANTATVAANPTLAAANTGLTVEAWIKLSDYNRTGAFVPIVAYGRQVIGNVWALQITPQSTLAFYMKVNGAAGSYLIKSNALVPSQVYQVVATYDGGTAKLYINGALTGSVSASGPLNYSGLSPQYGLTVGGAVGGTSPTFNGAISDVSIYPAALPAATVQTHYLAGHLALPLVETPARSDAFVDSIGVVTHLRTTGPYTSSFPTVKNLIAGAGIRHIGDTLTSSPSWYVQEIEQLAAAGVHSSLITDFTQNSATIAATLKLYANAIEAVEGPNEPDLHGDAQWVSNTRAFQQMLWSTVKNNAATAGLTVVGPSLTSLASDLALGNLSAYMDRSSLHDYFDGHNPGTPGWGSLSAYGVYGSMSYNRTILALVSGAKPVFATETGYGDSTGDSGGVDDRTLARYVPRVYLEHFINGIERTTMYELYDEPGNANFDDYGLVRTNNAPKSSYYAIKSLISMLADPGTAAVVEPLSYVLSGNIDNVHHLLLQKRDGTYELVAWVETQSYDSQSKTDVAVPAQTVTLRPASLPSSASIATIGDTGTLSTSPLTLVGGTASFPVDDRVTIVSFK